MKKLLVGAATAIAVILVAAFAAPFLIPGSVVKAQLASLVRQKTDRDLRIAGSIGFTLLPRLTLVVHDASLSSPLGGFSANLLEAKTVEVSLNPAALLHGAIEIDQLRLTQPVINFEIDKQGRRNWIFHRAEKPSPSTTPPESGGTRFLTAGNLMVVDGEASYLDQRKGQKRTARGVNMTLSLPSLDGPLQAAGTANCNGDIVRFAATIGSPGALNGGGGSDAALALSSARATLDFQGKISGAGPTKASGTIGVKMPSLGDFLGRAELPLAARRGFGHLSIDAQIELAGSKLTLGNLAVALDDIAATGTLAIERGGERPALSGHLDVDRLDLTPYLARDEHPAATAPTAPAAAPAAPGPAAPAPALSAPPASATGWSDSTIDLAPLKRADAELTVAANAVRMRGIEIGQSSFAVHLKNGWLELDMSRMALYGGSGAGKLVVDGSGPAPALAASLELKGITVRQVPIGVAGFDELSGTGDVYLLLSGHGRTMREVVASLNGGGSIAFVNGTIGSAGLTPLMKNSLGPAVNDKAIPRQIEYRSLSGTATIERGILHNSDLQLGAAAMSATGAGLLDLPQRRIDYLWQPNIPGLGNARMAITGTWGEPLYKVQSVTITKGVVQHPGRAPTPAAPR